MQESSDNMSANNDLLLKHRRTHDVSTTKLEYNGNVTLLHVSEPRPYPNTAPTKKRRRCANIGACFKSFLPGACFGGLVVYISLNRSDAINASTKSALSDIKQMRQRSDNFYDLRPDHIRRKQDAQQKMTSEQRQQKQSSKKISSHNKHNLNSDVEVPVRLRYFHCISGTIDCKLPVDCTRIWIETMRRTKMPSCDLHQVCSWRNDSFREMILTTTTYRLWNSSVL